MGKKASSQDRAFLEVETVKKKNAKKSRRDIDNGDKMTDASTADDYVHSTGGCVHMGVNGVTDAHESGVKPNERDLTKSKKKKKKEKNPNDDESFLSALASSTGDCIKSLTVTETRSESDMVKKKKKKRKMEALEVTLSAVEDRPSLKKKRKQKASMEETQDALQNGATSGNSGDNLAKSEKKKKKKKAKSREHPDVTEVVAESVLISEEKSTKTEQKKQEPVSEEQNPVPDVQGNGRKENKKRKKKEMEPDADQHHGENIAYGDDVHKKKRKKKDNEGGEMAAKSSGVIDNITVCASPKQDFEDSKKKKKRKMHSDVENVVEVETSDALKSGKKRKKSKNGDKSPASSGDTVVKGSDTDITVKEADTEKRKKKKRDSTEHKTDNSLSTSDSFSVTERNPGETQKDGYVATSTVDSTSGQGLKGVNSSDKTVAPDTSNRKLGQWNTTMFESTERQDKFLRLLGGFKKGAASSPGTQPKKGLFGSLKPSTPPAVGGQTALSCDQAKAMNQRLESDFERALTFRLGGQRGIGLGFQPDPAEGKKFHIDVNKTASKKFDD